MTDDQITSAVMGGAQMEDIAVRLGVSHHTAHMRIQRAFKARREAMAAIPSREALDWAVSRYGLRGAADHYNISSRELLQWMRRRGCGSTI